jgi:ferredoxin
MSAEIGTERAMDVDEPTGAAGPVSGEVPLRRPRDNRRRRSSGRTGAIPVVADPTTIPAAEPTSAPRSDPTSGPATGSVPRTRTTGTPPGGMTGPLRQLLSPMTGSLRLGRNRAEGGTDQRLRVDWPQCKAHGLCAEIAPEIIHLDEWGYPVFDAGPLAPDDVPTARKAMQVCPTLALRLADVPDKR